MHPPALTRPLRNKCLQSEMGDGVLSHHAGALETFSAQQIPGAPPVQSGWRFFKPHCVVISDTPNHENSSECIDHERRIEILQISRADDDRRSYESSHEGCKRPCTDSSGEV